MVFTSREEIEEKEQMTKKVEDKGEKVSVKSKERKRAARKEPG